MSLPHRKDLYLDIYTKLQNIKKKGGREEKTLWDVVKLSCSHWIKQIKAEICTNQSHYYFRKLEQTDYLNRAKLEKGKKNKCLHLKWSPKLIVESLTPRAGVFRGGAFARRLDSETLTLQINSSMNSYLDGITER